MTTAAAVRIPIHPEVHALLTDPANGFAAPEVAPSLVGHYARFNHPSGVTVDVREDGAVWIRQFPPISWIVKFERVPPRVIVAAIVAAVATEI